MRQVQCEILHITDKNSKCFAFCPRVEQRNLSQTDLLQRRA